MPSPRTAVSSSTAFIDLNAGTSFRSLSSTSHLCRHPHDFVDRAAVVLAANNNNNNDHTMVATVDEMASTFTLQEDMISALEAKLAYKEQLYKETLAKVKDESRSRVQSLRERMESLAMALQEGKFAAHRREMELQQQYRGQVGTLEHEIATLRTALHDAHDTMMDVKQSMERLKNEKITLQNKQEQLQAMYRRDSLDWGDQLESEQDGRRADQQAFQKQIDELEDQHRLTIRMNFEEAQHTLRQTKTKMTQQLMQAEAGWRETKEDLLMAEVKVEHLTQRVGEYESERASVRRLLKQSMQLMTSRVRKRIPFLNKNNNNNKKGSNSSNDNETDK